QKYVGDDQWKAFIAANTAPKFGYTGANQYTGEGVYWYDVEQDWMSDNAGFIDPTIYDKQLLDPAGHPAYFYNGNAKSRVYPNINTLAFDQQGRLIIGTLGGLWRGVGRNFSYDFVSGGLGVIAFHLGVTQPTIAGMEITDLNNNLQDLDLTSV